MFTLLEKRNTFLQFNYVLALFNDIEGPAGVILIVQDAPDDAEFTYSLIDCHCRDLGALSLSEVEI